MVVEEVAAAAKLICTVQLYANVKTSAKIDRLITCTPSDVNTDCGSSFYHIFSILDSKIKLSVYNLTVFNVSYNFPFASDTFCVDSIPILFPVQDGRHIEKRPFSSLF